MDPVRVLIVLAITFAASVIGLIAVTRRGADRLWAVPVACALAMAALFLTQEGLPRWPPLQQWHSIVTLAAIIGIAGSTWSLAPAKIRACQERFVLLPVVAAILMMLILRAPAIAGFRPTHAAAIGLFLLAPIALTAGAKAPGFAFPAGLAFAAITTSALLFLNGFAKGSFVTAGLASALGASAIACLVRRAALGDASIVTALALIAGSAAVGRAYADEVRPAFEHWVWLLPPFVPLGAWLAKWPGLHRHPRAAAAVGTLASAVLALLVLAVAAGTKPERPAEAEDPYASFRG